MKQLLTFFALSYLISWAIWLPLYGHAFGLHHLPTVPFHHALGGLGPLLASFITTWIFYKREGVKQLFKKCLQLRPLIYLLIALLSPFLLAIMAMLINHWVDQTPIHLAGILSNKEFPDFNLLSIFIDNVIFFGFGEEVGWRGFALPRFQTRFNALTSSIMLTFFWALWHWPLFLYRPGYSSMEIAGMVGWLFSLLTGSVLLTWLYNSSRASILICAVFHATIDIPFTANIGSNSVNYLGFLITLCGIMTILIFKPNNLAKCEREKFSNP